MEMGIFSFNCLCFNIYYRFNHHKSNIEVIWNCRRQLFGKPYQYFVLNFMPLSAVFFKQ